MKISYNYLAQLVLYHVLPAYNIYKQMMNRWMNLQQDKEVH